MYTLSLAKRSLIIIFLLFPILRFQNIWLSGELMVLDISGLMVQTYQDCSTTTRDYCSLYNNNKKPIEESKRISNSDCYYLETT